MNYSGKRVLITGADGFIGSHLAEALVDAGAKVTALAQYNSFGGSGWLDETPQHLRADMEIVHGDVRDGAFLHRLTRNQNYIFHLAALIAIPYSYEAPHAYVDTNVTGTLNMLEAARSHDVERVVHTSTSEVYGSAQFKPITESHPLQGQSPYSASKIAADMMAEAYARSFNLPVVTLRPFNTFGPRQSERAVIPTVIRQALDPACHAIRVGDLSPTRDFNYVSNTVSGFMMLGAMKDARFGEAYNAGTGIEVTIGEVVEEIRRHANCDKPVKTEASRLRPARSEVRALIADARKMHDLTGWSAATNLAEGLRRTIDWWRDRVGRGAIRRDATYLR